MDLLHLDFALVHCSVRANRFLFVPIKGDLQSDVIFISPRYAILVVVAFVLMAYILDSMDYVSLAKRVVLRHCWLNDYVGVAL